MRGGRVLAGRSDKTRCEVSSGHMRAACQDLRRQRGGIGGGRVWWNRRGTEEM